MVVNKMISAEQNKAVVRRFFEEAVNKGNLNVLDQVIADDFLDRNVPPGTPAGPEGVKQFLRMVRTAFPDLHVSIDDMLAEGEKVVARLTVRGTHKGELMGIPPTGRQATWGGMDIIRIAGTKMAERWGLRDFLGMMQQLGVISLPVQK